MGEGGRLPDDVCFPMNCLVIEESQVVQSDTVGGGAGFRLLTHQHLQRLSTSWTSVRTPNPVAPFAENGRPS